jgi:hypothetical protein
MQQELVSSCCFFCPLNSGHCGHPQYGTNEFWDLLANATDNEPLKKMVSVKDSESDARLANAQVGGNSQDIVYYLAWKVFPGNLKLG